MCWTAFMHPTAFCELYRRFFPQRSELEAHAFVDASRSAETMAEFQELLLVLEHERGRQIVGTARKMYDCESEITNCGV